MKTLVGSAMLSAVVSCAAPLPPTSPAQPAAGAAPPRASASTARAREDFELESLTTPGKAKIETGRVTLLIFWATWHHPSKVAFPKLAELQSMLAPRGFTVVALSVDDTAKGCLETNGWGDRCLREGNLIAEAARGWGANFPVAWDEGHAIASAWKPPTMPTIYLLDRRRAVVHEHHGWHDGDEAVLAHEIEAML